MNLTQPKPSNACNRAQFGIRLLFVLSTTGAIIAAWVVATSRVIALFYVCCLAIVMFFWRFRISRGGVGTISSRPAFYAILVLCVGVTCTQCRFGGELFALLNFETECHDATYGEYVKVRGQESATLQDASHIYYQCVFARDGYEEWTKAILDGDLYRAMVKRLAHESDATVAFAAVTTGSAPGEVLEDAARRLGVGSSPRHPPTWWTKPNVTGVYEVAAWLPEKSPSTRNRGRLWLYDRTSNVLWILEWNWQH
jgi:hypothetical protein